MYRAFEMASESLKLESLAEIAKVLKLFLVVELCDACPANIRRRAAYVLALPANAL